MKLCELALITCVSILAGGGVLMMLGYGLAAVIKPLRRFYCWFGWHSHTYDPIEFDGASTRSRCKWCKGVGLVDSQGNLFSVKHER